MTENLVKSQQTLRVMRALAGRDARALHVADDHRGSDLKCATGRGLQSTSAATSGFVRIVRGVCAKAATLMDTGTDTLQSLKAAGWVVRDDAAAGLDCWRLSNAGRLHLKRALSSGSGGVAGSVEGAKAQPASEARTPAVIIRTGARTGARTAAGGRRAPTETQPGENELESPLGWLRRRKDKAGKPMLSDIEFAAGERLRADFTFAHMGQRVTASWSPTAGAAKGAMARNGVAETSDDVADAQDRVRRALAALEPDFASLLMDVCCYLKGLEAAEAAARLPKRSGKVVLVYALRALARHYGRSR